MATDNKAVTAYLPPYLEESLTQYCAKYDISRKDKSRESKPALGTGIVEVLKAFFSQEVIPSPLPDSRLNRVEVEKIIRDVLGDNLPSILLSNVPTREEFLGAIASLREEVLKK